jgi:thiamine-phosphate pyrophosphorylase
MPLGLVSSRGAPPLKGHPILCWVLDVAALERCGDAGLREICDAGVDWLQLRDRSQSGAALLAAADRAVAAARASARGVRVIVNRRVDVARAAGADGVHLGFDAMRAEQARALLDREAWIGVSLHDSGAVGAEPDADYVHLAPIFAPLSKTSDRTPLGLAGLRAATRAATVIAQGGIQPDNAREVLAAGAAGVAVTGTIANALDPARAARALRSALDA